VAGVLREEAAAFLAPASRTFGVCDRVSRNVDLDPLHPASMASEEVRRDTELRGTTSAYRRRIVTERAGSNDSG